MTIPARHLVVGLITVALIGSAFGVGRLTAPSPVETNIAAPARVPSAPSTSRPPSAREDLIQFARSRCALGITSLIALVAKTAPRDARGDARAAWELQVRLVEGLALTDRNETVAVLRSTWIEQELSIRDLLLQKLALQGSTSQQSVLRDIGLRFDARAQTLNSLERMELDYGVLPSIYVPAGGCKTYSGDG